MLAFVADFFFSFGSYRCGNAIVIIHNFEDVGFPIEGRASISLTEGKGSCDLFRMGRGIVFCFETI